MMETRQLMTATPTNKARKLRDGNWASWKQRHGTKWLSQSLTWSSIVFIYKHWSTEKMRERLLFYWFQVRDRHRERENERKKREKKTERARDHRASYWFHDRDREGGVGGTDKTAIQPFLPPWRKQTRPWGREWSTVLQLCRWSDWPGKSLQQQWW